MEHVRLNLLTADPGLFDKLTTLHAGMSALAVVTTHDLAM
jgi:hypothetical protein